MRDSTNQPVSSYMPNSDYTFTVNCAVAFRGYIVGAFSDSSQLPYGTLSATTTDAVSTTSRPSCLTQSRKGSYRALSFSWRSPSGSDQPVTFQAAVTFNGASSLMSHTVPGTGVISIDGSGTAGGRVDGSRNIPTVKSHADVASATGTFDPSSENVIIVTALSVLLLSVLAVFSYSFKQLLMIKSVKPVERRLPLPL